jgi:ATP-dependent exoDNAse (exonuclease V) beta subunit
LLALIWPDVAQPVFATAALAVSVDAPQLPANTFTAFVPPLIRLRQPTTPTVLQGQDLAIENDNPPLPLEALEGKQRLEASVGTLVHRVLQQIVVDGQANWPISRVQALQPAWQRWLARQGHALDAIAGSDEAAEAIIRTLNSKVGQWLMADHLQSAAEEAWSSLGQNGTSNHVIDRTFVFENQRWIIDYKTVRLANGVGRDALATRAESFRPQLQRYSNLFQSDALPLRTAIYFPLQDELVEL